MTDTMIAENGKRITLHFAVRLSADEIVDSTFEGEPASCVLGDGSLLPGFEEFIIGMSAGDRQEFQVPPEKAFGQPNPQNVQEMKRSTFPVDMPVAPGLMVSFADAQNAELPGVINEVNGDWVTVDFNHPLAGKTILFDVELIEVQDAD